MKFVAITFLFVAAVMAPPARAAFELAVSPSRIVVPGKPGERIGQSFNLTNVGRVPNEVALRTLDWSFSDDGNVTFYDELRENSCRQWVTLERRFIKIAPQATVALRLQIEVPPDTPRRECRFMLAIEGVLPAHRAQMESGGASLSLPINGRIAVAVYVIVGGAEPKLEYKAIGVKEVNKKPTPVITVSNTGDAHGRLEGSLESVDAKGLKFELVPDGSPVMPGQTRTLVLNPRADLNGKVVTPTLPIKSEGQLDWDLGSFKVNVEFK